MAENAWAQPYEAPTSLDAARVLGARPMRSTLWTFAAVAGSVPLAVLVLMSGFLTTMLHAGNEGLADLVSTLLLLVIAPTVIWLLVCMTFAHDFGQRPAEHWLRAWSRHRRLPTRLEGHALRQHHSALTDTPRGCVEVIGTTNLRMSDDETLASTIKRLGVFFNGLRFPIQIIVRAWPTADGLIERRWLIALSAQTDAVLASNIEAIVSGLSRAGLRGHPLNGDLYDTLQRCWTDAARGTNLGPHVMERHARHVVVDGQYVRGFVVAKMPRVVDPNWLAPLLDGDLACDFSMWLDPTDNADELDYLAARVNEWETAQVLNTNSGGYRDPDIDDCIKDAARTRLLLRRRELRVFRATLGFVVRGATVAEMTERERLLRDQLREQIGDEALIPLDYEHDRAPLLVVPLGEPSVEYQLRTVTPAIARGYPFSNSSVVQANGIDVGTSVGSRRQNKINLFSIANPHCLVLGCSGAGKGFWVKVFLWRLLHSQQEHPRIIIIQAEKDEYSALADHLEPTYYGPTFGFMPRGSVVRLTSLDDLTAERRLRPDARPDRNVRGINESYDPIVNAHGVLTDYHQLVVYDLTGMSPKDRGKAIAWLLTAVERSAAAAAPGYQGLIVIDELGIVIESEEAAVAIETAYRRFRSIPRTDNPRDVSRLGMIGISQRPSDLLRHPRGRVLADLALTHVYFRQKSTELKRVSAELNLSTDEQNFLDEQCDEGTGLLVADRARVGFHLYATEVESRFATT